MYHTVCTTKHSGLVSLNTLSRELLLEINIFVEGLMKWYIKCNSRQTVVFISAVYIVLEAICTTWLSLIREAVKQSLFCY